MEFSRPSASFFLRAAVAFACVLIASGQNQVVFDAKLEVVQVRSPIGTRRASFSYTPNGTEGQPTRLVSSHNDLFAKGWTKGKPSERLGFNQGFCIETYYNTYFECFFSFGLSAGAVTVQGPYSLDYNPTTLLVTGARGIYEKYRGTVRLTPNVPEGQFTWSFDLVRITG